MLSGLPFCKNWNHKFPLDNNHNQALEDEEAREARDKVDGEGDVEDVVAHVKLLTSFSSKFPKKSCLK